MDYVAEVKEKLNAQLIKEGFSTGGENGADKVLITLLINELGQLNARIEELEKK